MYELREYQKNAVESGIKTFDKGGRDVIVVPTGGGKSLIIADLATKVVDIIQVLKQEKKYTMNNVKVLILCPTAEIIEQNYEKICNFGYSNISIYSASLDKKELNTITLATVGSIYKKLELFSEVEFIICDEAHKINAKGGMYEEVIKTLNVPVLGLTATPYRLHAYNSIATGERSVVAKMLTRTDPRLFDKITHITQIKEMYDLGFLSPVRYTENDEYRHSDLKLNSTGMDFTDDSLRLYNEQNNLIKKITESVRTLLGQGTKHILVFTKFVEEAQSVSLVLKELGITSESVSAETKPTERKRILGGFKDGTIKVVANVGVLTTGFDFPELDGIILARPTQSVALFYQMVGRGVRKAIGKEFVDVVDLCGNVERFGKIEEFELVPYEGRENLLRLRSDVGYLTGYDFISNRDLEAIAYRGYLEKKMQKANKDMVYIGKWKNEGRGTHISKIDNGYLEWAIVEFKNGAVKKQFIKELDRRKMQRTLNAMQPNE